MDRPSAGYPGAAPPDGDFTALITVFAGKVSDVLGDVVAVGEEPVPLILQRMNRLRRGEETMTPDPTPSASQPPLVGYTLLCLTALMAMVLVLMENERELPWLLLLRRSE